MSLPFPSSLIYKKDHLRVLSLEPARDRDANLIGSLRVTTLRDEYEELVEPYTAISYVWGDPTPVDKILLNGHDLGITENLGAALRDIRDATRVRRIWADAICIDQRNIEERNQQVAMMGQIYFHANSTIIYLGPLEPHSEFVLRAVQEAVRQDGYTINVTDESPLKMPRDAPYDVETVVSEAEKGLLFRPWFRRIWVLQELVISRNPWVQCGTNRVRWRDLCRFIIPMLKGRLAKAGLESKAENGPVYDIESMNDIRAEYSRRGAHPPHDSADSIFSYRLLRSKLKKHKIRRPCSLREILRTRLGCQLSDPRDAIFAHLGIISDRDEILKFVKLDYNQTITELLTAVARAFIKQGGLELLMEGITPSHPLRSILPSWVPDWRIEISRETLRREVELTSTSSLCHSTYAEPFDTISAWEILCVSGPLPSPG
ncbi:heterokaryon incompatibility protein-domain-containing protein [Xylaria grammica]|nr:heterokaryon incompatibility protein-domain-containing protein [Xylaria grammica]